MLATVIKGFLLQIELAVAFNQLLTIASASTKKLRRNAGIVRFRRTLEAILNATVDLGTLRFDANLLADGEKDQKFNGASFIFNRQAPSDSSELGERLEIEATGFELIVGQSQLGCIFSFVHINPQTLVGFDYQLTFSFSRQAAISPVLNKSVRM